MNVPTVQTEHVGTVDLRIPSKAEWVAVARLAVAAVANRLPFSVEEIEDLKLAIAEACTICIQETGASAYIDITCEAQNGQLRLTVRDRGATAPAPAQNVTPLRLADARSGGLGVFLIRSLMDEVDYTADVLNGTLIVMTKRVSA